MLHGVACWFALSRGPLPWAWQQSPASCEVWNWYLDDSKGRGEKHLLEAHTPFPDGWEPVTTLNSDSFNWQLCLNYEISVVYDFHYAIFQVHINDVWQICFEIPSCWEIEGLWENLWAHSLAHGCSMPFTPFENNEWIWFSTQLMPYLGLVLW